MFDEKWRAAEVIDSEIKKSLNLLVLQVQCDELMHARLAHHASYQFGRDAASLPHLTVSTVWQVGYDSWSVCRNKRERERERERERVSEWRYEA